MSAGVVGIYGGTAGGVYRRRGVPDRKGATPGEGAAPEVTLEEPGYFFSAGFGSSFFSGVFAVLSAGAVFTALSAASVTQANATATKRAQITESTFFIEFTPFGK